MSQLRPGTLTEMFANGFSRKLESTPRGMAYLAGTGPKGETCRTCIHFMERGRYASRPAKAPAFSLLPGLCREYRNMADKRNVTKNGPKIPVTARACSYWKENPNPPAIVKRPW